MSTLSFNPNELTRATATRLTQWLLDEFKITIIKEDDRFDDVNKLQLRYMTSLLGIEGHLQVFMLFSFDEPLIHKIFEIYAGDLDISAEEQEQMMEETAGDLLNIVVGNVLNAFTDKGERTSMTPPLTVTAAKSIIRHKNAMFNVADLKTKYGTVSVFCIGPKALFDQELNYRGNHATH